MAGIGFELKNLFSDENSTFEDIKAIAYSALIGVGPWLITVITLNILMFIGEQYILLRSERNLFMTAIVYSFIFSQILTGTIQYLITRFISDCIYSGEQRKLRAAYIGSIKFITFVSFFIGVLYFKSNNLPWFFTYTLILLFCFLSGVWISMNFISVVKNYVYSLICYVSGNLIAILIGIYLLRYSESGFFKSNLAFSIILSYTIGIGVTFFMLYTYLIDVFQDSNESEFEFLRAFKRYSSLSLIGIFFNFAMWAHIFVNWIYGSSYKVGGAFLSSPLYEVAVFYAFFLTIPTMVYFLVFMETKFFPSYKRYYALLTLNGNLKEINEERIKMINVLREEIYYIMELQFFISFSIALISKVIFLNFSMDLYLLDLFRIMIFAAYCTVFISVYIIIFLYFDSRKEALIISSLFLTLSILFSIVTSLLGEEYNGLGFFLAAFVTLVFSEIMLNKISKNLNYITFYKQNFSFNIKAPLIEKVENILNKRFLLPVIIIIILLLSGCSSNHTNDGFNIKTKRNWNTMSYYNKHGYNFDGYNQEGTNSRGFTKEGWNIYTDSPYDYFNFDYAGINSYTGKEIDERGFDYTGHNRITNSKYDKRGFDFQGLNSETKTEYDKAGWTWYGLNKNTNTYYDKEGYNIEGFNENGYNRQGFDSKGNKPPKEELEQIESDFEEEIYDKDGYDKNGYDENGVNREGFNKKGVFVGDGD